MSKMSKRRRTSPVDETDGSKRRKLFIEYDVIQVCQDLYDILRSYKTDDGKLLCESFIRAPNRRSLAEYYDVVTTPMDLIKIQQKLKTEEYETVDQMTADVNLLVANGKAYYKKNSPEYKDAVEFWELYCQSKNDILNPESVDDDKDSLKSSTSSRDVNDVSGLPSEAGEDDNTYEELFAAVMCACDVDGRSLSNMFQLLPSRSKYPDYFKVIAEPIDLKTIAMKIKGGEYTALSDLEKDLLVLVKNAKQYNEPGSQIYKDAVALRKVITSKVIEIEHGRSVSAKTSERIRARRLAGSGSHWSSIVAALQYDDDEYQLGQTSGTGDDYMTMTMEDDEDDNESEPDDADSNQQWQLYDTVKSYANSTGYQLSEPFVKLPSKRVYPDYYKEIKHPVCLSNIKARIKNSYYMSTTEVVDDLNLMFENAKKYNRPDSRIYKDAVKLQKIMQIKAKELYYLESMKESDSEVDSVDGQTPKRKMLKKSPLSNQKKMPFKEDPLLKKRLKLLFKTMTDFIDETGRILHHAFLEKPPRKDYPDYYDVIVDPIDLKTIEKNIICDKYTSPESFMSDCRLMFSNCRQYNEEGSQIYSDAVTLERVLLDKLRDLGVLNEAPKSGKISVKKVKAKPMIDMQIKLKKLYEVIRDFTSKGRKLSSIFLRLPSKTDYPDYYEVIKRPIDMQRIQVRLQANQYESLEDMLADFVLMFDNACKYNEPDSHIYKDALALQRIALQTKLELTDDSEGVPDVRALVQELLTNLFISVYNHQDEEGRCYGDSLVELAEIQSEEGAINLDIIKKNLNRGRYRRLDRFQEDMFEVFAKSRKMSKTYSQAFEDSIELQSFFIKIRDELCRNGELLLSPALSFTEKHLMASIDKLKSEKLPQEEKEVEEPRQEKIVKQDDVDERSVSFKEQTYRIGDFVYIEPRDKGHEPHIIHLEKFSKDNNGEAWIHGCWFYRPNETFHLATRKFLQNEVFKSDNYNAALLSQVIGKCFVAFVKDYFKTKPESFADKDVYVCESRYSTKAKSFKKIKIWPIVDSNVKILDREELLTPTRVPSVFKEGVVIKTEENVDNEDDPTTIIDKIRPNVETEVMNPKENSVYFEQYNIPAGCFKIGDTVLVRTESGKNLIGRIDQTWVDRIGGAYFHGPWFVTPQEVQHSPTRLFYKKEVFLSSIEDTNPLLSIVGKCAVLDLKDYMTRRPTEVLEPEVFVCESRYLEAERQIRKLPKGLKKPPLTSQVTDDEIYFFRKPYTPQKEPSPYLPRVLSDFDAEDSNDASVTTSAPPEEITSMPSTTPVVKRRQKVTGYIMYASEVRKAVSQANPDSSFGEISRKVGQEWKILTASQKSIYEDRAHRQNEENALREALKEGVDISTIIPSPAVIHTPNAAHHVEKHEHTVYECQWETCDVQFEEQYDLSDHMMNEITGHIRLTYQKHKDSEFQCLWNNCSRVKKNMPPFPNMPRLVRHVKDVHIKPCGKIVPPENRNANFILSSRKQMKSPNSSRPMTPQQPNLVNQLSHQALILQSGMAYPHVHPRQSVLDTHPVNNGTTTTDNVPTEPLFIGAPPKPHRLLHSESYLRYIENLTPECHTISNWDRSLQATQDNTPLNDSGRLPVHWLGNGVGNHGNAVNALWALRDFMVKDALNIANIL